MNIQTELVSLLKQNEMTIACAESCTGGLISKMITDVPGSSEVFELGVCSYSNRIKIKTLGVPEEIIGKFTEVSAQCAEEMAIGVMRLSGADVTVSTTGYAGPGGGTDENPVGTVFVALAADGHVVSYKKHFEGGREEVRESCAEFVLGLAADYVKRIS